MGRNDLLIRTFLSINSVIAKNNSGKDFVMISFNEFINVPKSHLCIMASDIKDIKQSSTLVMNNVREHSRTSNRKGEIIPSLLSMIPDFDGVDLQNESVNKIATILEAAAASRGVELTIPDKNTWAKYLGRK
ncbi:hypothetical protein [Klebsiella variicola]|uniref:hypothetical protein n=1 Tax=Klebsiella variicola TaxID=244366 RepID=UPI0013B435E7